MWFLRFLLVACFLVGCATEARADPIQIDFTQHQVKHTTTTLIDLGDGLTLTIDNPTGLAMFNRFHIIDVGLRVDGGLSPHIDLTFSKDVQLNSYTLGEVTGRKAGDTFTLSQGALQSQSQPLVEALGTHQFTSPGTVFKAGQAIRWTTATPEPVGTYALSGLTISAVPEPSSALLLTLAPLAILTRQRRRAA